MSVRESHAPIDFAGPVTYRIVVQGVLSDHWRDRVAGLTVTTAQPPGRLPRTTLVGRVRDQAELNGVLDTLYGLHLPIIVVETVEAKES